VGREIRAIREHLGKCGWRNPHHVGQQTEARRVLHDLFIISGLKRPPIGEKEAAVELVTPFPAVHLESHPGAERLVLDMIFRVNFSALASGELSSTLDVQRHLC
jgi:hypothetical protein